MIITSSTKTSPLMTSGTIQITNPASRSYTVSTCGPSSATNRFRSLRTYQYLILKSIKPPNGSSNFSCPSYSSPGLIKINCSNVLIGRIHEEIIFLCSLSLKKGAIHPLRRTDRSHSSSFCRCLPQSCKHSLGTSLLLCFGLFCAFHRFRTLDHQQ